MKKFPLFCAILALLVSFSALAESAEPAGLQSGSFSVTDQSVFWVSKGGEKRELKGVYVNSFSYKGEDENAVWFQVDEDLSRKLGEKEGIYCLQIPENRVIGFLPIKEEDGCYDLIFSPGAKYVAADFGSTPYRVYGIYDFESGEEIVSFPGMREFIWVDSERLVYTNPDRNERDKPGEITNCLSAALYDMKSEKTTILKQATETSDYRIEGTWGGTALITEYYVKSSKDWSDDENIQERRVTVPIP
ncbi:MAG: hypothetical protein LBU26_03525 [Synergistaceae bacterium]|jgi:hypothetical protein|nr:hypothetical protein [Synergistaceae bacterium]